MVYWGHDGVELRMTKGSNDMSLALFDFDGTIIDDDSYIRFVKEYTPKWRLLIGSIIVWPMVQLYKRGWLNNQHMRPVISWLTFVGRREDVVKAKAAKYAASVIPNYVRPDIQQKIDWHKAQGHRVVVVSASLDVYLREWCKHQGVELVCSQLKVKNGKYTGGYVFEDCACEYKVIGLRRLLRPETYPTIYAYGDTPEDMAMLALADHVNYQGRDISYTELKRQLAS